ncbi:unnamed protein product [Microthlaspi erraticum]|uniref:RING-type E3 ubiquitin transferase n=1 Tax=Microthlaspi erraticum TaxID=1685480 RepID=A0A6D2IF83_9BRAS|nr:unnamed protein product [Microthlaspi erraticum]
MLLLAYYRFLIYSCNRVYNDADSDFLSDDDHNPDRGVGISDDDHVIITIKDLACIDPSLQSIPVVDFNPRDFKDGFQCIVCLSNLLDGDRARLLPTCNHWFHADCIDTWLQSHSTCPICRTEVGSMQRGTRPGLGYEGLTTNVAGYSRC